MKKIILLLSTLFFLFTSASTAASGVIRDSEIEESINKIAEPIFKAARVQGVKIYLVQDETFNAFTTLGDRIYIFSGVINQIPDIDALRGIIAHEVGHIVGGHIVRRDENTANNSKIAASSIVLGLAGILSGVGALAIGPMAMGMHIADRNMMAYSRSMESSADQAALRFLEQSHNTAKGMMESFEYLAKQHNATLINPYDQTHPMSKERLVAIKNFYQNSKYKDSQNTSDLKYYFKRSQAKLQAFTTDNPKALLKSLLGAKGDAAIQKNDAKVALAAETISYMKAILYFRLGDLNEALKYVNSLIAQKPKDAFYHELKGQILFEFGKKESIDSYNQAAAFRPNDLLILLSRSIVGITINRNSPDKMRPFFNDLKLIAERDPEDITPLYYMAIYYEKIGQKSESLLNSAIIAQKTDNIERAKALAAEAIKGLKPGSPSWYRASDIIAQ
jgi:predicted Zn-dependent protease